MNKIFFFLFFICHVAAFDTNTPFFTGGPIFVESPPTTTPSTTVATSGCCPYSIHFILATNPANVSSEAYKCNEPIAMTCALNGRIGNTRTVGIAGFKKGATREQYEILAQGYMEVVETLVCDPSTGYFHIEKSSSEYETFWCAFRNYGNDWWIDLPEP